MARQRFYRVENILEKHAQYNLLLGERSNGKSYAVKEFCLKEAWERGAEFVYLRRWRVEIKYRSVEKYFDDMVKAKNGREAIKEMTGGEWSCIAVYQGEIFFARYEGDKRIRSEKRIGHVMCLTGETHYKSLQYPLVENIILEEFTTTTGYIPREPETLMSIVSTVLRRETGRIFCIGNTVSQVNPFFNEWQLIGIPKMQQGQIDVYHMKTNQFDDDGNEIIIDIAVEYCENSGNNSKMFFGKGSEMITGGAWDTESYPHLERRLETYDVRFKMYYVSGLYRFALFFIRENDMTWIHIQPQTKDIPEGARVVNTSEYSLKRLQTQSILHQRTKYDIIVHKLINERKITVSDNLTGTNFFQSYEKNI